jgi:hypothetical protein
VLIRNVTSLRRRFIIRSSLSLSMRKRKGKGDEEEEKDSNLRLCLNLRSYLVSKRSKVVGGLNRDIVSLVRDWLERNDYVDASKRYREESKEWLLNDSLRESSGIRVSNNRLYARRETVECAENDGCVCCMYKLIVSVPRKKKKLYVANKRPEMCVRAVRSRKNREKLALSENMFGLGDDVLILGDGDLSYSCSISSAARRGAKITSTTYLTSEELFEVYDTEVIKRRMKHLRSRGVVVRNGVDATRLGKSDCPFQDLEVKFSHVIWNFPCIAPPGAKINTSASKADGQNSEMSKNQELLRQFFDTVHRVLRPGGEVRVTHKTKPPYCDWNIVDQASSSSSEIKFQGCLVFDRVLYPGYTNRKARSGSGSFPVHDARIFVFRRMGRKFFEKKNGGDDMTTWLNHVVHIDLERVRGISTALLLRG